jgi:hypothetical protein
MTYMDTEQSGTFLVAQADSDSAMLRNVASGQVHALASNPGIEAGDVIDGSVGSEPPLEVTWNLTNVESRRSIPVERGEEPPTSQEREIAADIAVGEIAREERAGTGELHVLSVPPEEVDVALTDVLDDEETLARAARLGVNRVEVRSDREEGVLSVRYLP